MSPWHWYNFSAQCYDLLIGQYSDHECNFISLVDAASLQVTTQQKYLYLSLIIKLKPIKYYK